MSISKDLSSGHHSFSLFSPFSFSPFSSFSSLSSFSSFSSFTEKRLSLLRLLWYSSIGTKQPSSQSNIVPFGLNWTCGILSMGAAGPRGKRRTFASWLWGTPPPWCAGGHHHHLDEHRHHSC